MTEPKEITRQEANEIIIEWRKSNQPLRQVTGCYKGKWYDLRKLTNDEILQWATKLMGRKPKTVEVNL